MVTSLRAELRGKEVMVLSQSMCSRPPPGNAKLGEVVTGDDSFAFRVDLGAGRAEETSGAASATDRHHANPVESADVSAM